MSIIGCAVCFGEASGYLADGAKMGAIALLAFTGFILACLAAFFISLWRRAIVATRAGLAAEER